MTETIAPRTQAIEVERIQTIEVRIPMFEIGLFFLACFLIVILAKSHD